MPCHLRQPFCEKIFMARIQLEQVFKAYGDHPPVIRNVSLDIGTNEFCVFVGPSGCGKSTLLRMVAGLESINSGTLRIGEQAMNDVAPAQRGVSMVFQSYALFPHMTVFENMAFGLRLSKVAEAQILSCNRAGVWWWPATPWRAACD